MKRLHFQIPNNLSLLHDELLVAIPALAPIRDADGLGTPVMQVEGDDNNVWLTVPDNADEAALVAVVQAHDPTQQQPDPRGDRLNRIREIQTIPRSNWTSAQMRELIDLVAQEITR